MYANIIGADMRRSDRQYSPCGVAIVCKNDFITSDMDIISTYNTDVFSKIGSVTVPVYSNLADIPASRLPNRLSVKVTDEAYPSRARLVNTNFRVEYLGGYPSSPSGESIGVFPVIVIPWVFLIKVAAVLVTIVITGAVICMIFNGILAMMLPGGVSGAERDITDTRKLITYPDGSWAVYDTESGDIVDEGDKPSFMLSGLIVPIVLGVAGIAGIYVFIKYGMPAISGAIEKPRPKLESDAG